MLLGDMLGRGRARYGWTAAQAAGHIGIGIAHYRELEAGSYRVDSDTYDRIADLYGWPQHHEGRASK
jgi:transcriptional regulator with XRE-family HTH domain